MVKAAKFLQRAIVAWRLIVTTGYTANCLNCETTITFG